MRRLIPLALIALVLGSCADAPDPLAPSAESLAPLHVAFGLDALQGSYIVVLKPGTDARSAAAVAGVHPRHVYDASIRGFAAELTPGQLNALRRNPTVAYVETDRYVALAPPCGTPRGGPCSTTSGHAASASRRSAS